MRVAFFIPSLSISGGQAVVALLAARLSETEDVCIIVNTGTINNKLTELLCRSNVKLFFVKGQAGRTLLQKIDSFRIIATYISNFKPDIINVHLDYYYTFIYSLIWGKNLVYTVHTDATRLYSIVNKPLFYLLNKRNLIDYILLSQQNKTKFCRVFGVSEDKAYVAPNPINLGEYRQKTVKNGGNVINYINVARFHAIKNHKMLLDAFAIVLRRLPYARLHLVGDGELFEEMKTYAKEQNISEFCTFYGSVDNVEDLLLNSDVAVLSSDSECLPMFLIESMAAGLPIVATNVGGIYDMIDGNGFMTEAGDSFEFAKRMIEIGENTSLREEFSERSKQLAAKYDINVVSEKYKSIFKDCIKERKN